MKYRRFPFVRQNDSRQCGSAALATICQFYGKKYSIEFLTELLGISRHGVSLHSLSEAAKILGFRTMCVKCKVLDLLKANMPIVLHWSGSHYVVLYKIKKEGQRYCICDPARGRVEYSLDTFLRCWTNGGDAAASEGVALLIEPTENFGCVTEPVRRRIVGFQVIWDYFKIYRKFFAIIVLGLVAGTLFQMALPLLTQTIVDVGIRYENTNIVWMVLIGELCIICGRTATDVIRNWLVLHVSMRINLSFLSDFFVKILRLPIGFFDSRRLGDLMQRMSDHKRIQSFMTTQVLSIMFAILTFIAFGVALFCYSRMVWIVFMVGSIMYGVWVCLFLKKKKRLDYERFERDADHQNITIQLLDSIPDIKLHDCEQRRRWEWEDVQTKLFEVELKSLKVQQVQDCGAVLINEMKNIVVTLLAANAVIDGSMTFGAMVAIQYICGQLNSPLQQMVYFSSSLQDVAISLDRINEIHALDDENESECDGEMPGEFSMGDIEFRNVVFSYDRYSTKKIINNVSLNIPAGKTVAIVGESGSGKSTLLKLLLGFYEPQSGEIRVGGKSLKSIGLRQWRRMCGVVMQDGVIFAESIERNIAVDDGDIDYIRLAWAAKMAVLDEYINSLPNGFKTVIGKDGSGLSVGQRQRVLLARAIYKNPQCIILDEATNSLDTNNERAIVENLEWYYSDKTAVIVAHRLSTVRNADIIIVLEDGQVVEMGSHFELISQNGRYYSLIKNQLEHLKEN